MLKIFLASHGRLASGMKSSLDILLGNSDHITVYDAYIDETNVQTKLDEFYGTVSKEDHVILLSDLYGGSVNQVMFLYLDRPNTTLIAGVNLALVLEIAIREEIGEEELQAIVEQSRSMLKIVKNEEEPAMQEEFF